LAAISSHVATSASSAAKISDGVKSTGVEDAADFQVSGMGIPSNSSLTQESSEGVGFEAKRRRQRWLSAGGDREAEPLLIIVGGHKVGGGGMGHGGHRWNRRPQVRMEREEKKRKL
jgi:hypothetical protein